MSDTIRSEKLIKNTFWSVLGHISYAIVGFFSRSIFVNQMGDVLTGVATLFSSILSLLSMAELGFGSAIALHLYKPVADKNERKVCALLNLYRSAYKIISLAVLAIGLLLLPFIQYFVKVDQQIDNLKFYFLLYVLKSVASYSFAYKSVLITVSQESYYKANIANLVLSVVTVMQAVILHYTANFALYLVIGILGTVVSNVWVSWKADKLYPYLKKYKEERISEEERKNVFSFIRATAIDRISSSVKTATDNMIISGVVNVTVTGIVGNYNMIISTVNTFLGFFYNNVTPAVGNMVATVEKKTQYNTFLDLEYISFWLYGFLSAGMLCLLTPFVKDIWIRNPEMVLTQSTLFWVLLNFFLTGICTPGAIFFNVTGLIKKMPFINLSTVLVNLVLSLGLVMLYDVDGVYMGTVLSMLLTNLPLTYYFVLRNHFAGIFKPLLKLCCYYFAVVALGTIGCTSVCGMISLQGFGGIISKIILCTVVFNVIFFCASFHTREFRSIYALVKKLLLK